MPTKPEKPEDAINEHELLKLVVEEVDEAREVHELARQLLHAIPLQSFEDIVKAVGPKGTITFRGNPSTVQNFAAVVPGVLFPIDSVQKLLTLLYETVRLAPPWVRYRDDDVDHAKRKLRRLGILGLKQGTLGATGSVSSRRARTSNEVHGILKPKKTEE